jgi:hypothetical protein
VLRVLPSGRWLPRARVTTNEAEVGRGGAEEVWRDMNRDSTLVFS